MNIKTVSIVGCGWFGLPLARELINQGFTVSGSKRTSGAASELNRDNIAGFTLDLDDDNIDEQAITTHLHTDAIVINIPPEIRKSPGAYLQRLTLLKRMMANHPYKKLIFISTTGVYPASPNRVTEQDAQPHSPASEILLQAENIFRDNSNSCVIRFAGLVGPSRNPGRFLAGKKDLAGADSPVNIVHLDDCIGAVACVLVNEKTDAIYNLCAAGHPTRKDFYAKAAQLLSLIEPEFSLETQMAKEIDGGKITRDLGFNYRHKDPMDMLTEC
ncbi:NAD(P)-dependent oxidoreductase [Shewanella hanedai]|uniref:SDR family oxidoreductase n=1 Tax=Shewanella hanedai TaxID=25 RepID=A0A553JK45_SHEHA|nr:SDR family oxidoreductase [Shewanella hanedai]TRY12833.1 SDR family oxidoreductase [Shewanella hanedai]GGI92694.1 NAD(P)-dependent oxidoreductase [Shewanella hanedai]